MTGLTWRRVGLLPHGAASAQRCWRGGVLAAMVTLLMLTVCLPGAYAQDTETITVSGHVANGTAGAKIPVGEPVRVIALGSERIQGSWEAPVQEDGSYAVTDAIRIPGATYAVGIEYAGGTYIERLELPAGASSAEQDLMVYESVATDPGIRFEQSAIVFAAPNAERGTLEATEVHSVYNPTDVTFIPSAQGPGGPAGLLVFALPPGAGELTPLMGIEPGTIAQIDRGFAVLMPIYPGRTDVSFRYRFPYDAATFHLERTARYPVDLYRVLSSEPGVTLASPQLPESSRADIGGRTFQAVSGGPFDRGSIITVDVAGLPTRGFVFGGLPLWTLTAAGALAGLAAVALAGRRTAGVAAAPVGRDEEEIVDRLLTLEQARDGGRIDEETYRANRQELVAAALRLAPKPLERANGGPPG